MRHPAGELADRFHLLRLEKLLAGLAVTVHRLLAHARFDRDAPIEDHGEDGHQQDQAGDHGDDRGEQGIVERAGAARLVGFGEAIGRRHGSVVHRCDGEAQDQRANHFTPLARHDAGQLAEQVARLQGDDRQHHGDDDRCREQGRVVADEGVEPHRRHAGVVHGADAGAHQRAADQQAAGRDHRAGDDVQGDAGGQDGRHDRQGRDDGVVGDRDRQDMGEHADEVHGPDGAAHGDGANGEPAEPQPVVAQIGDPRRELQEGVAAESRHQVGQEDEAVIVAARQCLRRVATQREEARQIHRQMPPNAPADRWLLQDRFVRHQIPAARRSIRGAPAAVPVECGALAGLSCPPGGTNGQDSPAARARHALLAAPVCRPGGGVVGSGGHRGA